MGLRQKIAEMIDLDVCKIPGSYQVIGSIMILKFPRNVEISKNEKSYVAESAMKIIPSVKTVCESSGIEGELRKPKVSFLAGIRNFSTIHRENGISYSIDVSRIMFSKGNLFERQRVISQIKPGETVVDMFAGIGYFSLGIAKFSKAENIISIEKNPISFKRLKQNIKSNGISNIIAINGDCREISNNPSFIGISDRIIMGYLPKTFLFLPYALRFAKPRCIIHYHDTFFDNELWKKPQELLERYAKKNGFEIRIIGKKKVKSFAPRVWHVVIDCELSLR